MGDLHIIFLCRTGFSRSHHLALALDRGHHKPQRAEDRAGQVTLSIVKGG